MYLNILLLLLSLLGEWQLADADCGKACFNYTGTTYIPCQNRSGHQGSGGGQGKDVILVQCDQKYDFTGPRQWYELPDGVTDIIITQISVAVGAFFSIGRLICSDEDECFTMTLAFDTEPQILIRLKSPTFKIQLSGLQFGASSLSFIPVCERKCAQMKMPRMKRIVGGVGAIPHEFPFIVRLTIFYTTYYDENNYVDCNYEGYKSFDDTKEKCAQNHTLKAYRCGGSILNDRYVLTAQHCVLKTEIVEIGGSDTKLFLLGILVHAGDHDTTVVEAEETLHWVIPANVERAPNYNVAAPFDNDIALLKVSPKIKLHKDFRYPICLPPMYMDILTFLDGCAVEAAGWGLTAPGVLATKLQKGDFTVVGNAACSVKYGPGRITDNMICMDHLITVTCKADSGGPVFCKSWQKYFYLVGVISFGELSDKPGIIWDNNFPDVNARVTRFVAWIKGIVGAVNLP